MNFSYMIVFSFASVFNIQHVSLRAAADDLEANSWITWMVCPFYFRSKVEEDS